MDSSGNSSLQSSASGGDEEEYDSRPRPPPPPPPPPSLQLQHQQQHHHQHQQASLNFLNPFSSNQQNPNPLLFSHHHQTSLFDPSQNFFHPFPNHHHHHHQQQQQHQSSPSPPENPSFLNLDMVPSSSHHHHHQFLRSDHTMLAQQPSSPSASSLPHANPPAAAAINNNNDHHNQQQQSSTTSTTTTTTTTTAHGSTRNPKKRTRASRRAPTTVLTTDTSNFRAMVQEFTGIPAPPFSAASPYSRLDLFGSSSSSSAALRSGFDSMIYPLRPAPHKLHNHLPSSSSLLASSQPNNTTTNTTSDLPSAGNFQLGPSAQNMMMNQMLSLQSLLQSNDLHHSLKPLSSMIGNDHQIGTTTTTMGSGGDWGDRVAQPAAIDDVRNPDREMGNSSNNNSNDATEFILHHQNV